MKIKLTGWANQTKFENCPLSPSAKYCDVHRNFFTFIGILTHGLQREHDRILLITRCRLDVPSFEVTLSVWVFWRFKGIINNRFYTDKNECSRHLCYLYILTDIRSIFGLLWRSQYWRYRPGSILRPNSTGQRQTHVELQMHYVNIAFKYTSKRAIPGRIYKKLETFKAISKRN